MSSRFAVVPLAGVLLALTALAAVTMLAGCGDGSPSAGAARGLPSGSSPAEMRLERADLALVVHGLQRAEPSIRRELSASRAAWPAVVHGLPRRISASTRRSIAAAVAAAALIQTPHFISYASELTGASSTIAGLLLSYEGLSQRGWTFTQAAVNHLSVRFLRVNAALYIGCVYDAHYNLGSISAALLKGYRQLGGAAAFGKTLSQREVEAVAGFYSPAVARLEPKPPS